MLATEEHIVEARRALNVYCPTCQARGGGPCRPASAPVPPLGVHDERIEFMREVEAEQSLADPRLEDLYFPGRVTRRHGRLRSS